jgi:ssDNA-binding Zn-finger/Zn-ribbon topoisomerase 1
MKTIKLKLAAWPYSRKLVIAICDHSNIKYKLTRDNKTHETFEIECDDAFIESIENRIKKTNSSAISLNKGGGKGFSGARNQIVNDFIVYLNHDKNPSCPKCHTTKIIKNGKDKSGIQKYKCKSCSNNFKV